MQYESISNTIDDIDDREDKSLTKVTRVRWPLTVRLSLSFLGYLTDSTYQRRCIYHAENGDDVITDIEAQRRTFPVNIDGNTTVLKNYGSVQCTSCDVCESLTPLPQNKDIGKINSSTFQKTFTLLWLCFLSVIFSLTTVHKIGKHWGNEHFILYILSYTSFMGPIMAIAINRLVAYFFRPCPPLANRAIYALTTSHVMGLLKRVDMNRVSAVGYAFYLYTVVCIGLVASFEFYHVFTYCPHIDYWGLFYFMSEIFAHITFSSFWLVILYLRRALQADLKAITHFLQNHHKENATCRERIMESFLEFTRFDSLISGWMFFQIGVTAFKCSCHIYWNYKVYANATNLPPASLTNALISIQVCMYFIIPLFAVGWFNIRYVWKDFLSYVESKQNENDYWPCFKMIRHLRPIESNVTGTLVFSVLSAFLSLQLTNQSAEYWQEDSICHTVGEVYNITVGAF